MSITVCLRATCKDPMLNGDAAIKDFYKGAQALTNEYADAQEARTRSLVGSQAPKVVQEWKERIGDPSACPGLKSSSQQKNVIQVI
jgi:hypothetical protein